MGPRAKRTLMRFPRVPANPITVPGDLWIVGDHRILCGDATLSTTFDRLLDGCLADMTFTDPPYNVDYRQLSHGKRRIANDNLGGEYAKILAGWCQNLLSVTRGAIDVCMSSSEIDTLKRVFTEAGGYWSTFIIWAKNTFTLGRSDYQRQYEPILYGWREGSGHFWCGASIDRTIRGNVADHPGTRATCVYTAPSGRIDLPADRLVAKDADSRPAFWSFWGAGLSRGLVILETS
jgi:hypothetical protein